MEQLFLTGIYNTALAILIIKKFTKKMGKHKQTHKRLRPASLASIDPDFDILDLQWHVFNLNPDRAQAQIQKIEAAFKALNINLYMTAKELKERLITILNEDQIIRLDEFIRFNFDNKTSDEEKVFWQIKY